MPAYQYQVVFFCSESTAVARLGGHAHSALFIPGLGVAYSWGRPDAAFRQTGPGRTRTSPRTPLGVNVYYHDTLGYGHSVHIGTTNNTSAANITAAGEAWYQGHEHGGQYPNNCRGAVDDFLDDFAEAPTAEASKAVLATLFTNAR
jgi:hypothetical protein